MIKLLTVHWYKNNSIKVIKNKFTGGAAGYGFINFISDNVALTCMHKLNGKIIPGTQPPVRYKISIWKIIGKSILFLLGSCSLTVPLLEENISGVPCWKGIRQDRLVGVNSQKVKKAIVLCSTDIEKWV